MTYSNVSGATTTRAAFAALARRGNLGKVIRFETANFGRGKWIFSAVLLLVVGTLMVIIAVESVGNVAVMVVPSIGAAILLWLLVGVVKALIQGRTQSLGIYEGGFIHQHGTGPASVVPWSDVHAITRSATTMVVNGQERHTYVLVVIDGEHGQTRLTEQFANLLDLSELLETRICESLLPGTVALLHDGAAVEFGPLVVDRSGISREMDRLPWSKVARLYQLDGKMTIVQRPDNKPWTTVPLQRLPNAKLLMDLAVLGSQGTL